MTEQLASNILKYIEDNMDNKISIDEIADYMHYDKYYLQRIFKKVLGITIKEYINERKIIKSINKLLNSDDRILKIALTSGFNSLEYYSEMFYKVTSYSPLMFRKTNILTGKYQFVSTNNLLNDYKNNHKVILYIQSTRKDSKQTSKQYKKSMELSF